MFLNNSARKIKFKLCTAVIYCINVILSETIS